MNVFESITAIMSEVKAIGKDKKNQQQGFHYRGIDDVYNRLQPLLAQHKVFTVPEVLEDRTEDRTSSKGNALIYRVLKIKYTFYAEDGSSVSSVVIGEGMDSGDKASNKAMAIAHKYALFQVFCIPTEDMVDPDSEVHKVQPRSAQSTTKAPTADPLDKDKEKAKGILGALKTDLTESQVKSASDRFKGAKTSKDLADLITWAQEMAELNAAPKMPAGVERASKVFDGEVVTPEDIY